MSERQPTQPDKSEERLFYEATIVASKERNPGLVALELSGDIEAARKYFTGYQEVIAEDERLHQLSEHNKNPKRMASGVIQYVATVRAGAGQKELPSQEQVDALLGVWKQVFEEALED
jgi:hypothetical protein